MAKERRYSVCKVGTELVSKDGLRFQVVEGLSQSRSVKLKYLSASNSKLKQGKDYYVKTRWVVSNLKKVLTDESHTI